MDWQHMGEVAGATLTAFGLKILGAIVAWIVGRYLIGLALRLIGATLTRQEVDPTLQRYVANIVKCRPLQNRVPEPEEANTCTQFLFRQIEVIRPQVIVALGATAATYLLGGKSALARLRGRLHEARGAKLIVTYHPAYLLRDPTQKKEAWKDLQLAMAELGLKAQKPQS